MEKGFTCILTNKKSTVLYVGATKNQKTELIVIEIVQGQFSQKNIMLQF